MAGTAVVTPDRYNPLQAETVRPEAGLLGVYVMLTNKLRHNHYTNLGAAGHVLGA